MDILFFFGTSNLISIIQAGGRPRDILAIENWTNWNFTTFSWNPDDGISGPFSNFLPRNLWHSAELNCQQKRKEIGNENSRRLQQHEKAEKFSFSFGYPSRCFERFSFVVSSFCQLQVNVSTFVRCASTNTLKSSFVVDHEWSFKINRRNDEMGRLCVFSLSFKAYSQRSMKKYGNWNLFSPTSFSHSL